MSEDIEIGQNLSDFSGKFSKEDWKSIEQSLTKNELNVLKCLKEFGENPNYHNQLDDHLIMGEEAYLSVRKDISKKLDIDFLKTDIKYDAPKNKDKKVKLKSADLIRLKNAQEKIKSQTQEILNSFNLQYFDPNKALTSPIIELRGIGFLYCGWFLINHSSKYQKKKQLPFVLGIIVAIQKYINVCSNYVGKSISSNTEKINLSTTLILDLKKLFEKLVDIYPYNGFVIYDYAPELLVSTEYDYSIPKRGIRPRNHQIEMMNKVRENTENGFIIAYNAMINSGKTTYVASLASYVEILRKTNPKYKNLQLIFCCNLASVKNQVANICYNTDIKFGIASDEPQSGGYRIINHYSFTQDSERSVIVTVPMVATKILSDTLKFGNGNIDEQFILFLDEPTIGADNENSDALKENISLISVMPKMTILSSATFPELEKITHITENYKRKYPNAFIGTVYSPEIQIGCDIKTLDGNLVVPHLGVSNANQLKNTINAINKCPFLGRTYTSNIVRNIYNKMIQNKIQNIPNISELFSNIDNLTSDKVRQIAMEMLDLLSQQSDKIIKSICSSVLTNTEKINYDSDEDEDKKEEDDDSGFVWDDGTGDDDNETSEISFDKLGTKQSYRFMGMNLITTIDPVNFALTNFSSLIEEIEKTPLERNSSSLYKSALNIIKIYEQEMALYEKQLDILERNTKTSTKKTDSQQTKKQEKINQVLTSYDEQTAPKYKFPNFGQINTNEHINKYAKSKKNKIIERFVRTSINLEALDVSNFNVPDRIITLLFAGVGIYSPSNKLDYKYMRTVLELAQNGRLAYLIADSSICYGTNYPINRVFVTDDFAEKHSINTLFQLFGRAGRVNKASTAEVILTNKIAMRIINFTKDTNTDTNADKYNDYDIETKNMLSMYDKVQIEKKDKYQKLLLKLKEEQEKKDVSIKKPNTSFIVSKQKEEPKQEIKSPSPKQEIKPLSPKQEPNKPDDKLSWRKKNNNSQDNKNKKPMPWRKV